MEDANKDTESHSKHDEADPDSPPSSSKFTERLNILVSAPETIEVELVNSATLDEYEFRAFLSSVLSAVVIGFFFANVQSGPSFPMIFCGIVSAVLFVFCAKSALDKRRQLKQKAKKIWLSG